MSARLFRAMGSIKIIFAVDRDHARINECNQSAVLSLEFGSRVVKNQGISDSGQVKPELSNIVVHLCVTLIFYSRAVTIFSF